MEIIKTDSYDIIIEKGAFLNLADHLRKLDPGMLHLIVDSRVYRLYQEMLPTAMGDLPYTVNLVRDGEESKSFATYQEVLARLLDKNIRRDDTIVALGGGVIGDLAGFLAATIYRGIDFVQVPTTLLSMVDSSIGGKTALNLPQGKNLVGAFHMPKKVLIDPNFLNTLPEKELLSGLVETYKHALLGDAALLEKLSADHAVDETVIKDAIDVKKRIVASDPYDRNERHVLNFGHTFGHAIERQRKFSGITHGEAVAEGMVMALQIGVRLGITPPSLLEDIKTFMLDKRLISEPLLDYRDFLFEIRTDKKTHRNGIRFVFLEDYQKPLIKDVALEDLG